MKYYVAVEVEHVRYARFLSLDQIQSRSMELTTLADNQRRADINIYLIKGEEKILLHSFIVTKLPQEPAGEPRLTLHGRFDGTHTVRLEVRVDGRRYDSTEISLKRHLPRKAYLLPLLIALALVVVGGGAWLTVRGCSTPAEIETSREGDGAEQEDTSGAYSQDEAEQQTEETESPAEADTEETEDAESERAAEADAEEEAASSAADTQIEPQSAAQEPDTQQTPTQERPTPLKETVYFTPDSARLTNAAKEKFRQLLPRLKDSAESGEEVAIVGHCALYGTEQGRLELSVQRARAVYQYLQALGWSPEQQPRIKGMGGRQPVTTDREEQQLNRRVEVLIGPQEQEG